MWHVTCDMFPATPYTWHVGESEPSLRISAPYLLRFGNEGFKLVKLVKDIFTKDQSVTLLMNHKGVCRTALATLGMLKIVY